MSVCGNACIYSQVLASRTVQKTHIKQLSVKFCLAAVQSKQLHRSLAQWSLSERYAKLNTVVRKLCTLVDYVCQLSKKKKKAAEALETKIHT